MMTRSALTDEEIFQAARRIEPGDARRAYLDQACGADLALREQVEALLRAHDQSQSFLESPASAIAGRTSPLTLDQPQAEFTGVQIGPYKLLQQIGEGGMGVVYMAEQHEPVKRRVALKIIKPGMDTRQVIARFEAERQALSLMDHPNIAKVLDAGTTESGRPYFVMELVKGQPITQYCDEHHLTPRQRLELLLPVCQAIQHAHQKGIIHRDIKPTNILVAEYDSQPVPKVIDFGVAKATSQALTEKTMFTGFGQIVGTLEYMSPEQAKVNQLDIDTRSDIYSLGVLLYELLTGSTPFDKQRLRSAAWDEILRIIREEEPEKPSTRLSSADTLPSIAANRSMEPARLGRAVRGELDWIVMKALEKDRNRRYETANGFAADIQHYLNDEPVLACPPSAAYRFGKFARRNRGTLATVAIVSLALLLGTGVSIWQAVRARQAEQQATTQRNVAQVQRRFARQAVDKMFTQVAEKWLSRNASLRPIQKQILLDALQIYEELAQDESADPRLRLERGNAYRRIGEIYNKFGNDSESERAFRKAQEFLGSLVDQYPAEAEYRSALATAWHQYGFALHYSARMDDALVAYRQALLHWEKLVAEHPEDPRYARQMAVSLGGVGNMLDNLGPFSEVEAAYGRAIHVMENLPREVKDDPDCRFELGLLYSELSGAQLGQGRNVESQPLFYQGKAIYEQLVLEFPQDPTYREELAWAFFVEANRVERPEDAVKACRRALEINEQLAREAPTGLAYRKARGNCYRSLGIFLERAGNRPEAEEAYRKAEELIERLLAEVPDWAPSDFGDAFSTHRDLQRLLVSDGRAKEAEAIYLRALEIYSRLSKSWRKNPSNLWKLAEFRWDLATLAAGYGRGEEATRFAAEALQLYDEVAAAFPQNLVYQNGVAARRAEIGNFALRVQSPKDQDPK